MFLVVEGGKVYNLDFVHYICIETLANDDSSLTILFANGGGKISVKQDRDEAVIKKYLSNLLEDMMKNQKVIALRG